MIRYHSPAVLNLLSIRSLTFLNTAIVIRILF
jgi:hypothetical protein